ncbi:MAG: hypothetical protein JNJ48_05670 [Phycisphaerae bacterium]|nr:hypothetical protein [Phycisphaerae bacterium]
MNLSAVAMAASLRTAPMPGRRRVLHLLDPSHAGEEGCLGCVALQREAAAWQEVWLVGSSADERLAASVGVRIDGRVTVRRGLAELGTGPLRRLMADRVRAGVGPDVVHCWSIEGLSLARAAFGPEAARAAVLPHGPTAGRGQGPDELRVDAAMSGAEVACWSRSLAERWSAVRVEAATCDVPRLEVDGWEHRRAQTRSALGIGQDELVVLHAGDPVRTLDAKAFAVFMGTLRFGGARAVGLMPAAGSSQRRAARYVRALGRTFELVRYDGPQSGAMPAADLVLWGLDGATSALAADRPMGGVVLAATACAAGIPVIAQDCGVSREVLGARPELLCGSLIFVDVARPMLPLALDSARRAATGGTLRDDWRTRSARSAFVGQVGVLWERAITGGTSSGYGVDVEAAVMAVNDG